MKLRFFFVILALFYNESSAMQATSSRHRKRRTMIVQKKKDAPRFNLLVSNIAFYREKLKEINTQIFARALNLIDLTEKQQREDKPFNILLAQREATEKDLHLAEKAFIKNYAIVHRN